MIMDWLKKKSRISPLKKFSRLMVRAINVPEYDKR
jgi:hypothetical protein